MRMCTRQPKASSAFDGFSLAAPLWLIETRQGGPLAEVTYLQAEAWGSQFLLAFTSEEKALARHRHAGVSERARPTHVTGDARMEVVTVVCQVGAHGIIVDLDPSTRQCAWSRRSARRRLSSLRLPKNIEQPEHDEDRAGAASDDTAAARSAR